MIHFPSWSSVWFLQRFLIIEGFLQHLVFRSQDSIFLNYSFTWSRFKVLQTCLQVLWICILELKISFQHLPFWRICFQKDDQAIHGQEFIQSCHILLHLVVTVIWLEWFSEHVPQSIRSWKQWWNLQWTLEMQNCSIRTSELLHFWWCQGKSKQMQATKMQETGLFHAIFASGTHWKCCPVVCSAWCFKLSSFAL